MVKEYANRAALVLVLLLAAVSSARSQSVVVTGTITDLNKNPYANGTASAIKVVPSGQDAGRPTIVTTNASGFFTMTIPSGQSYVFTLCSAPVNIGPTTNPTPQQVCFSNTIPISITISQDISTILNPIAAQLGPSSPSNVTGLAAGAPPQTQVNDPGNPGHFGGTPCENFPSLTVGPINADCDWHSKGPNPYYDISRYGARFFGTAPQSTTATCNGTTSVTLAGAIDFVNGDGIVLHKCGPASSLSTPSAPTSVTPQGVLNGSTTRCYKVVAEDYSLGMTAASASTCTSTAASVFQTVNATVTNVVMNASGVTTVTTSANHNFQVGWPIQLSALAGGSSSSNLNGVYFVQTTPSGTTFTVQTVGLTTAGGSGLANFSATSGTASAAAHIFVNWPVQNNVMRYWVYRQDAGAGNFNLVGVAQGVEPFYDDYNWGVPATTNIPEVPSTAPASATNQALATSIVSGAATTSITVANAASNTISGITALHDDSVAWVAATNAIINNSGIQGGSVYSPIGSSSGSAILLNFPLVIPSHSTNPINFLVNGGLVANQPIVPNATENWIGVGAGGLAITAFATKNYAQITGAGYPLFTTNGHSQIEVENIGFNGTNPQQWSVLCDINPLLPEPATITFRHDGFTGGVQTGGVGLTLRGNSFGFTIDDISANMFGASTPFFEAPSVHIVASQISIGGSIAWPAIGTLTNSTLIGSGVQFDAHPNGGGVNAVGSPWTMNNIFSENACAPFIQFNNVQSNGGSNFTLSNLGVADTSCGAPTAIVDLCSPSVQISTALTVNGGTTCANNANAAFPSARPIITTAGTVAAPGAIGVLQAGTGATVTDSSGGSSASRTVPSSGTGGYFHVNQPAGAIVLDNPVLPTPSVAISAGGSIPAGTYTYAISAVDANGSESILGQSSNPAVVTPGNQTATITWTPVAYPVKGYNVYRSNGGGYAQVGSVCCLNGTGVDTSAVTSGITAPVGSAFGVSGISPVGGVFSNLFNLFSGAFKSSWTGAPFTANRSVTVPDINGVSVISGYQNSVYDNFNRANGGLGSNWTTLTGETALTISGNTVEGGTGASINHQYWSANTFGNDEFSQVTVTTLPTTSDQISVTARVATTARTYYLYGCTATSRVLQKAVAGSYTTLVTVASPCVVGDVIRLHVIGNTQTAFRNGVQDATASDTAISTGANVGLLLSGTSGLADNWSGGNLHPIAQLDTEQDWTQPQHFIQPVTIGPTNPVAGALAANTLYVPNVTTTGVATSGITFLNSQANAAAITGNNTNLTLFTFTLPANQVASLRAIRVSAGYNHSTGTASVTYGLTLNGQSVSGYSSTVTGPLEETDTILNLTSTTGSRMTLAPVATNGGANGTLTGLAWTSAQTLTLFFNAAGTEQVTPVFWLVELIP